MSSSFNNLMAFFTVKFPAPWTHTTFPCLQICTQPMDQQNPETSATETHDHATTITTATPPPPPPWNHKKIHPTIKSNPYQNLNPRKQTKHKAKKEKQNLLWEIQNFRGLLELDLELHQLSSLTSSNHSNQGTNSNNGLRKIWAWVWALLDKMVANNGLRDPVAERCGRRRDRR